MVQEATCSNLVFLTILCFFEISTCSHPFLIVIELIHKSSCSHPFDELPFFYYKRVIAATHSFKFTVFLQNRTCSKKTLTIIIITPWFQACIIVSWRHHFQPSIFSMIVSLFHGSTWRNPHVDEIVFISHYFLQPSITTSGLWLIRVCWRVCTYRSHFFMVSQHGEITFTFLKNLNHSAESQR